MDSPRRVLAGGAYDSSAIRALVAGMGGEAVLPCNCARRHSVRYEFETCKRRNLAERGFNNFKPFRRIATQHDRRARNFLSFALLAAAMIWTR